ncbi:hypothetical protein Leryth_026878 [Lithospermum erythrorhizon]|nr:hypothetical protein Leryth_026878 [Lithospermum erythrorhizon]
MTNKFHEYRGKALKEGINYDISVDLIWTVDFGSVVVYIYPGRVTIKVCFIDQQTRRRRRTPPTPISELYSLLNQHIVEAELMEMQKNQLKQMKVKMKHIIHN